MFTTGQRVHHNKLNGIVTNDLHGEAAWIYVQFDGGQFGPVAIDPDKLGEGWV